MIDRIARIDGVRIAAPILTTIYARDEDRLEENDALVVEPAALTATTDLAVIDGSLDDLDDNSMAVPDLWGMTAGSTRTVLMADGQEVDLRVAATYRALRGEDVAYLPPRFAPTAVHARDGLARRAYISLAPGTDRADAIAAIRETVAGTGATFMTRDQLVASETTYSRRLTEARQRSTALIIVVFCFIAILNTLLMSTADRRRDLAALRTVGATPKQIAWFFVAESLLVAAIGVVLALAATAVNLAGLWGALLQLFGTAPIAAPYPVIIGIAAVSAMLVVTGTVLPVGAALFARTMRLTRHHNE